MPLAKTACLKTIALRTLKDATAGAATRLVALRAAKPYLDATDYEHRLRQLAETARGKVLRLLLLELTEIDAATRADELAKQKRAEIDRVLADAERELALADPATVKSPMIQEDPNASPVEHAEPILGTPAVSLPDPDNGVLTTPVVAEGELAEQRADMLKRGRDLAEKVLHQTDRCYRAVFNKQESARLDALQEQWRVFECEALAAGVDVTKEFADKLPWLRRFPVKVDLSRLRRTMKRECPSCEEQARGLCRKGSKVYPGKTDHWRRTRFGR
jgi:hypothetical protein